MNTKYILLFCNVFFGCLLNPSLHGQSDLSQCLIQNALSFVNVPYQAGTLDGYDDEKLICRNDAFDCVTLVEYVVALSLYQMQKSKNSSTLEQFLTKIRYRKGKLDGYGSRLHYFSEWIDQQNDLGWCEDLTCAMGGIPYQKQVNFISKHKEKYPKISNDKIHLEMKIAEKNINAKVRCFIPKKDLPRYERHILSGDIIAITTNIEGLDIVHVGFAYFNVGKLYLLHASQEIGKVSITNVPLYDYLKSKSKHTGIMVIRPTHAISN